MSAAHYEPYELLAERGDLTVRVFWTTIRQPATPEQVEKVLAEIPGLKTFQGNDHFQHIGWGESVYSPVTTQLLRKTSNTKPEDIGQMRRIAQALAARAKSFQVPSNRSAPPPQHAPRLADMKLIDYDFARYGASAERQRLIQRWEREVGSQPR